MATPKLPYEQRRLLYDVVRGSRTTTQHWRDYLPLSRRGLVDILDSGREWGRLFGVSTRDVEATPAGRALAAELGPGDLRAWAEALEHAQLYASGKSRQTCVCGPCGAVWSAWRAAGYTWTPPNRAAGGAK